MKILNLTLQLASGFTVGDTPCPHPFRLLLQERVVARFSAADEGEALDLVARRLGEVLNLDLVINDR
jgi:hypothetical protein